jgi:hypothetical protein
MGRLLLISALIVCFWQTTMAIDLPRSRLLMPAGVTLAQQEKDQPSFTEVQRHAGERVRKSPWRAFGYSMLLPGGGQYYVGSGLKAKIFFGLEVGLWSAFGAFRSEGAWRADDYKLLAEAKAGADLTDKNDEFYDMLGFYESREEYNKLAGVYNRSRQYYPDDTFYFWKWDSEASRLRYRDIKNQSRSYYRKANFTLGLIAANHLISAVDAFLAARRHNRGIESGFSGLQMYMTGDGDVLLTINLRI